jgi:AcrR family transcriptional regulator
MVCVVTDAPKGRELWLCAGQKLLRLGGIGAVKLQALTDELGLTTGSFYHHFSGMADYLDQLARHYGSDQPREALALADDPDPRVRLRRLHALSRDERAAPLDTAMRDWAGSNPLAATAVHDADEILLRFIERAFVDLGYPGRAAQTRAALLFSAGVARISPPWRVGPNILDEVLDVLAPRS